MAGLCAQILPDQAATAVDGHHLAGNIGRLAEQEQHGMRDIGSRAHSPHGYLLNKSLALCFAGQFRVAGMQLGTRLKFAISTRFMISAIDSVTVSVGAVRDLARECAPEPNKRKIAVVAERSVVYGMGRMFQTLTDGKLPNLRIFRDLQPALEYLELL